MNKKFFSFSSFLFPVLSVIFFSASLPSFGFWPLVWFAPATLILFIQSKGQTARRCFWGVALTAFCYGVVTIYPLLRISGSWWPSSGGPWALLLQSLEYGLLIMAIGILGALFILPFTFVARLLRDRPYQAILLALVWVGLEFIRITFGLMGYSWGALGYPLIDTVYLKYIGQVGGVFALSGIVMVGSVALVELLRLLLSVRHQRAHRLRYFFREIIFRPQFFSGVWLSVVFFLFAFFLGTLEERRANECTVSGTRVAVIASVIPTDESIGEGAYRYYRAALLRALDDNATLIVFPENSFPFFELNEHDGSLVPNAFITLDNSKLLYEDFMGILHRYPDRVIAVGMHTGNTEGHFNSIVFYKGGVPFHYYHKRFLVPFTEYRPQFSPFSVLESFTKGMPVQHFSLLGVSATGLMCSEINRPIFTTDRVPLIIAPANDSLFASPSAAHVHEVMARMRALESGGYVLRAVKGGTSSIIAPSGEILAKGTDGVVVANIALGCTAFHDENLSP